MPTAEGHPETSQRMITNPLSAGGLPGLFATHPAIDGRVDKRLAMAEAGRRPS